MTEQSALRERYGLAWAERAALALGVLGFGLAALWLGQSNNWDLRNYHWYDGWAWLQQRGAQDLAAAQAQTWFNPLLPAALYLLLSSLQPWLGTFLLGCIQGLNFVALHRIALQLLPPLLVQRRWLVLLIALVGASGATQRGELGASFGDNLVSLPLLAALALLLSEAPRAVLRWTLAGALLGVATGLKLTAAPAAAAIALAAPLCCPGGERRRLLLFAAAAATAFLLVHGPWMLTLWREFGNPLFPLFGSWFGGDFVPPAELRDDRWRPQGALEWLFYPLLWADEPRRVSELWFLDLRVPLLYLSLLAAPLWWRRALTDSARPAALRFAFASATLCYLFWLLLFGYYRYLIVLEMLAPLLLALALGSLRGRTGLAVLGTLLVVIGLATRPPRWGRLPHYGDHYVSVQLPRADLGAAMVVLADREPLSFLIPAFAPTTRFVRISGNLIGPPLPPWALDRSATRRLAEHVGPLYLLAVQLDSPDLQAALQRQGLALERAGCAAVDSNLLVAETRPQLCVLRRASR